MAVEKGSFQFSNDREIGDTECRRPRRILVVFNPVAGWTSRRRLGRFLRQLRATARDVTLRRTTARGDAEAFARAAVAEGYEVVVAAGGDGTINEVVNGLAGSDVKLGIAPLGTANVFAHEIGLNGGLAKSARAIAAGRSAWIYNGSLNHRRFIQMAGVGFDARVVADVSPRMKRVVGRAAYVLMTLRGLIRYRLPRLDVEIDGTRYSAVSAVIAKGHFYAGRFTCAETARLDDPRFQICLFMRDGAWNVLRYALGLLTGRLGRYPDVAIVPGHIVRIAGPASEPVQADGDIVGVLPVHAEISTDSIAVIVPE